MASLVVVQGVGEGGHLPLAGPLVSVGREDTCTFQILDDQVSRKHLQIKLNRVDGRHYAGDYRSANGVFVNGARIVLDTALADGDQIRIGGTTLMYLAGEHADAAAARAEAKTKGEWKRETLKQRD